MIDGREASPSVIFFKKSAGGAMRVSKCGLGWVAMIASAIGCGSSNEAPSGPKLLTVASPYGVAGSASQDAALNALLDVVRARVPGIEITVQVQPGCSAMKCTGELPDVFLLAGGGDFEAEVASGRIAMIDAVGVSDGWRNVFSGPILESYTGSDGHLYGVPLTIERDNTMFFNNDVLVSAGVTPPATIADWFTAADVLKAKGLTPLAVSAIGGWTIASHLFEGLLVAEAGPQWYRDYMGGAKTADAPEINRALTDLGAMMDYANADRATINWSDAVKKLCAGEAPLLFLPDFVQGEARAQGCTPGRMGYVPLQPASTATFLYATTGWALMKDAPHPEMGIEFLKAVASREGQTNFVTTTGGIAARADLDPSRFDNLTKQSVVDLASPTTIVAPGYSALASGAFQQAVNPALQHFVDPSSPDYKNVTTMLAILKDNYATIRP
jgi:glucose/mannose transport system substrate-binding protein